MDPKYSLLSLNLCVRKHVAPGASAVMILNIRNYTTYFLGLLNMYLTKDGPSVPSAWTFALNVKYHVTTVSRSIAYYAEKLWHLF